MQTHVVAKTENSVTLEFEDANITLINPLIKALNENKDVTLVRFLEGHPELRNRRLYVEVSKGDALEAIKNASEEISDYYSC